MPRFATAYYLDGLLGRLENANTLTVCAGQPTSIADIAVRALASTAITDLDWTRSGASDRSNTLAAQDDVSITASGEADHVVIDDGVNYYVTVCPAQLLTLGGTVTIGQWAVTVQQPVAP